MSITSVILASIFVGGVGGYLGSLMVSRKMSLTGDALGHLALPGIALALLYNFNIVYGAFFSLILGIFFIWQMENKTKLPTESLVGIAFALGIATAFLILPSEDLETALIGDITKISLTEAAVSIAVLSAIFLIIRKIFNDLVLANLSEDMAVAQRVKVKRNNLVFLLCIAAVVALGMKMVGSLLVGALVIIPAAGARNISGNLKEYSIFSIIFGTASCLGGIFSHLIWGFSAGPMIVLFSAAIFAATLLFKKEN